MSKVSLTNLHVWFSNVPKFYKQIVVINAVCLIVIFTIVGVEIRALRRMEENFRQRDNELSRRLLDILDKKEKPVIVRHQGLERNIKEVPVVDKQFERLRKKLFKSADRQEVEMDQG